MRKIIILILATLLWSVAGISHAQPDSTLRSVEHDGLERTYYLHVPPTDPVGLVIILHPGGSSGRAMEITTGFNEIADQTGFLVAYPNAASHYWDDGRVDAGLPPLKGNFDDVGFITRIADDLAQEFGLESFQVYLSGMAIGGDMAMTAACQAPEHFGGIAIVGALLWEYQTEDCPDTASSPLNTLFIHGTSDHIYSVEGRDLTSIDLSILSAQDTLDFWANRNGCDTESAQSFAEEALTIYDTCDEGTRTAFYSVIGGGMNWLHPGTKVNEHLNGVDTNAIIAAFFMHSDALTELAQPLPETDIEPRTWITYVPTTYDETKPTPVVFLLHGRYANGLSQAISSDFNTFAEQEGIIAVYPDALNSDHDEEQTEWYFGRGIDIYRQAEHNDEAFFEALVDDLDSVLNIDRSRLYVSGKSNGGIMVQRLACTANHLFAAFASVAANAQFGLYDICDDYIPEGIPMLIMMGTYDIYMPWEGSSIERNGVEIAKITESTRDTVAFWVVRNHCNPEGTVEDVPSTDPDSSVHIFSYLQCEGDGAVVVYVIEGGGHHWPGIEDKDAGEDGDYNMDINTNEELWEFFSQFTIDGRVVPLEEMEGSAPQSSDSQDEPEGDYLPVIDDEYANQRSIINQLQRGGYNIFIALDLETIPEEPVACTDEVVLDEALAAEIAATKEAFTTMQFRIGRIEMVNHCSAAAVAQMLSETPPSTLPNLDDENTLAFRLASPIEGSLGIIIGDTDTIASILDMDVTAGQMLLVRPLRSARFETLTLVSPGSWSILAEIYAEIIERDAASE